MVVLNQDHGIFQAEKAVGEAGIPLGIAGRKSAAEMAEARLKHVLQDVLKHINKHVGQYVR